MKTTRGGKSDILAGSSNERLKNLVPGTEPYIAALMEMAREQSISDGTPDDIVNVTPPPPDTDWLRGKDLIGCWVLVMNVADIAYKTFPGQDKTRLTATYEIYVYGRPDLGKRKLDLASRYAVEQARLLMNPGKLPHMYAVEIRHDPENSQYDSVWLVPISGEAPRNRYYHKAWREEPETFGDDSIVDGTLGKEYPF